MPGLFPTKHLTNAFQAQEGWVPITQCKLANRPIKREAGRWPTSFNQSQKYLLSYQRELPSDLRLVCYSLRFSSQNTRPNTYFALDLAALCQCESRAKS